LPVSKTWRFIWHILPTFDGFILRGHHRIIHYCKV
jgi:hypothetical protein